MAKQIGKNGQEWQNSGQNDPRNTNSKYTNHEWAKMVKISNNYQKLPFLGSIMVNII